MIYRLLVLLMLFAPITSWAGTEWVFVSKVDNDNAIVVRKDGSAHLIEVGTGCISLWRKEGKEVLINSPGLFLGIGSKLILPDQDQSCRIWGSKELGVLGTGSAHNSQRCEDGHWISSVLSDGKILKLDDGSVWEVDQIDVIHSAIWLPISNVMICGDKIINTDDGEQVSARRLR